MIPLNPRYEFLKEWLNAHEVNYFLMRRQNHVVRVGTKVAVWSTDYKFGRWGQVLRWGDCDRGA